MTDSLEATITGRRTIHNFRPEPVPDELLIGGLQVACWAPNHRLNEPWHFYLPGPQTREAICQLNARQLAEAKGDAAAAKKLERWRSMPGWLVVTAERAADPVRDQENYAACCCLIQNLALYLWEAGVGLKWSTGEVVRDPRFMELLGSDLAAEQVVGLFWYGYPDEVPEMSKRPAGESLTRLP